MKLLIDAPEKLYTYIQKEWVETDFDSPLAHAMNGIFNGTPLDGLTNGEVMMKMFPNNRVDIVLGKVYFYTHDDEDEDFDKYVIFDLDWWNRKWGE